MFVATQRCLFLFANLPGPLSPLGALKPDKEGGSFSNPRLRHLSL